MSQKKRTYSAEVKTKVALAAIREEGTLSQLASKHNLNPNLVSKWKQQALQNMTGLFSKEDGGSLPGSSDEIQKLHAKTGQLTIELDFLAEASRRLGLGDGRTW